MSQLESNSNDTAADEAPVQTGEQPEVVHPDVVADRRDGGRRGDGAGAGGGDRDGDGGGSGAELVDSDAGRDEPGEGDVVEAVTQPAKVMRIGSMVKQLLEEVRDSSLDEASRERLAEIYERSIIEVSEALSPDLQEELRSLALPFDHDDVPSEAELRVAKAQLVGWLEGLFHGIQASMMAQQMAARAQLQQMRELPGGQVIPGQMHGGVPGQPGSDEPERPGTYL